jgi:hypothetical protein
LFAAFAAAQQTVAPDGMKKIDRPKNSIKPRNSEFWAIHNTRHFLSLFHHPSPVLHFSFSLILRPNLNKLLNEQEVKVSFEALACSQTKFSLQKIIYNV